MKKTYISPTCRTQKIKATLLNQFSNTTFNDQQRIIIDTNETADEFTSRRSIWDDEDEYEY